jgi:L-2-hydroxycarboxylate dehydrogenase (NAD+)
MSENSENSRRVEAARLKAFIKTAYLAAGLPNGDADTAADVMTEIDLLGGSGHGVFRLPQYIRRIKAGGINVTPNIHLEHETDSTALVNGDNCVGSLAVHRATEVAMEKAEKMGVGWAGVKMGNHAGTASVYARMAMEKDMIGIYSAVGSANHLPPWGGIEMLLSTNPIAIAVPAMDEPPVVLDMATTVAAYGKVKTAAQRGEQMPVGWMVDNQGNPMTDPTKSKEGFLVPVGEYKGYGMALVLGLLAGTLNGAAMGREVVDFNADDETVTNTGQFICAISLKAFGDVDEFKRQVDELARTLRASPTMPGFDSVRLPGENSQGIHDNFTKNGIIVHAELIKALDTLAQDLDINPL